MLSMAVFADTKSELKTYFKCYGQFMEERLDLRNDPWAIQIKNGELTGVQACMNLLSLANLGSSGLVTTEGTDKNQFGFNRKGQRVLETFNNFHRGWFSNYDLVNQSLAAPGTIEVFDSGDMAYYVTKSLFSSNSYKYVMTANESLEGIRRSEYPQSDFFTYSNRLRKLYRGRFKSGEPEATQFEPWFPPLVQKGMIVGIAPRQPYTSASDSVDTNNHLGDDQINPASFSQVHINRINNQNLFQNIGGGAIGTPSYLMMNMGLAQGQVPDGGKVLPRRFGQKFFQDVLCRELPVVRSQDAARFVDTTGESPLPFRKGISCMQCHSSIDPIARLIRNTIIVRTSPTGNTANRGSPLQMAYHALVEQEAHPNEFEGWIDTPDPVFLSRPQNGRFYYRTVDGELIDIIENNGGGLDSVMDKVVELDDYYLCASKRYLNFLTGIDLLLQDRGDVNAQKLNPKDQNYFKFLRKLAKKLKETQDLKAVLEMIIASNLYLKPQEEWDEK